MFRLRVWIIASLVLLSLLGLLVVTGSLWIPKIAPSIAARVGVEIEESQRTSEGSWRLAGVRWQDFGVEVEVGEMILPLPRELAWAALRDRIEDLNPVRIHDVAVEVRALERVEEPVEPEEPFTPENLAEIISEVDGYLRRWAPRIHLTEGRVTSLDEAGNTVLAAEIAEVKLQPRSSAIVPVLRGAIRLPSPPHEMLEELQIEAAIERSAEHRFGFDTRLADPQLTIVGEVDMTSGLELRVDGKAPHWGVAVNAHGHLLPDWMPDIRYGIELDEFFPEEVVPMIPEPVNDLRGQISGMAEGTIRRDQLTISADLYGAMGVYGEPLQAVGLNAKVQASPESITLSRLDLRHPAATFYLDRPLTFVPGEMRFETDAAFVLEVDLGGLDLIDASGKIAGLAVIEAGALTQVGEGGIRFNLQFADLHAPEFPEAVPPVSGLVSGVFGEGALRLDQLVYRFPKELEGEAKGTYRLAGEELDFSVSGVLPGAWIQSFSDAIVSVDSLHYEFSIGGTVGEPVVSFALEVAELETEVAVPLDLRLRGTVSGLDPVKVDLDAEIQRDEGQLDLRVAGVYAPEGGLLELDFKEVLLAEGEQQLRLIKATPMVLSLLGDRMTEGSPLRQLSAYLPRDWELVFSGNEGERVVIGWASEQEQVSAEVRSMSTDRFNGWLIDPIQAVDLRHVEAAFAWNEDEVLGEVLVDLTYQVTEPAEFHAALRTELSLGKDRLSVHDLNLWIDDTLLASGEVEFPVAVMHGSEGLDYRFVDGGSLSGDFSSELTPELRHLIEAATGFNLGSGRLLLEAGGTPEDPSASLRITLDAMELPYQTRTEETLVFESIRIDFGFDSEHIRLRESELRVRDGVVQVDATLPVAVARSWMQDREEKEISLETAFREIEGRITMSNFEAVSWLDILPGVFRQQGQFDGTLAVERGGRLSGELVVKDFALRPTLYFRPVEQIRGRLLIEEDSWRLEEASGRVGSSDVVLSGRGSLAPLDEPVFELSLKGENVPIIRTVDLVVRSDLDLKLQAEGAQPTLSGRLGLRSSSLILQFDPLRPSTAGGGEQVSPPFFAIEEPFVEDWKLEIEIAGERFLRVRSPFFGAQISADFTLTGRLGEPLLLGSLMIDEGRLRFPGANMSIDHGEVFITQDAPNMMQIDLGAIGRRAGFVINLSASGNAIDPQIQLNSSPALTNAQVLRLLTTGSLDGGGVASLGFYLGTGLFGTQTHDGSLADRISIDVGRNVTATGRDTIDVELELTERLSVRGEYDEYDHFNADLLWRLFRR